MEITTAKFIKRLKSAAPECLFFETEGEPVIGVNIPYEELSAFISGRTQFSRGAATAKLQNFADADWTAVVDYWMDQKVGIMLNPLQHSAAYELRIYPNRKEKK